VALATALCAAAVPAAHAQDNAPGSLPNLVSELIPSVVNITTIQLKATPTAPEQQGQGTATAARGSYKRIVGSGFIVRDDGFIVTNRHVIDGGVGFLVTFSDGVTVPAKFVAAAAGIDVAVLKIDTDRKLKAVKIGNSDALRQGDEVIAIGNPLGLASTVTHGIVSALDRDISSSRVDDFIQTDATINHGNSGGPLFNAAGEVIAVNTAIFGATEEGGSIGLNFAIPINDVVWTVLQFRDIGRVRAGWLGADFQSMTQDLANNMGLTSPAGAVVTRVIEKSGADGKLLPGDVILAVAGQPQHNAREVLRTIARAKLDQPVSLRIWRNGGLADVDVTVSEYPQSRTFSLPTPPATSPDVERNLGMTLKPLDEQARRDLGLGPTDTGVLVEEVALGSEAQYQRVRAGDAILMLQQAPVTKTEDVESMIASARQLSLASLRMLMQGSSGRYWVALRLHPPT
ncbi:MAG: trypsin-like peptidase domain-containing protein, partial [Acetobacteraceae bacterium]|nr:trypsin-like peptidase domain-containing protein [Acetobacteraceae bacterium]